MQIVGELYEVSFKIGLCFFFLVLIPLCLLNWIFNFMSGKVIGYMMFIAWFMMFWPLAVGLLALPFIWIIELRCCHEWEEISDYERFCIKCGKRDVDYQPDYRSYRGYVR